MKDFFKCGDNGNLTISSTKGGQVQLNSLNIEYSDTPWSGIYFQGNPVTVKAVANSGYKFDGWSGDVISGESSLTFSVTNNTNLQANFSKVTSPVKDIVINEINYNSSDDFESGDWVELFNNSDEAVSLSGWYYSDSDEDHKYFIPDRTVMEPGEYLVLVDNDSAFTSRFPDVQNYLGETGFGLSGSGEYMKLVDNQEQIVDSLTYDDKSPWPEEADGDGSSLELVDANSDNALAENWKASQGHGTPGRENSVSTGIEKPANERIPVDYFLSQNHPNPFNPTTTIHFQIPKPEHVTITVYDILGHQVKELINDDYTPGDHQINWDGTNQLGQAVASGLYIYKINAGNFVQCKKMLMMK
jgi:hypothetical protein